MPVLPYCILLHDSAATIPITGIAASDIHRFSKGKLQALYSELETSDISSQTFRQAALEFHRVVNAVFDRAAVMPFRFPTWLTQPELIKHLQQQSHRYTTFLTSHANHVQMEMRVTPLSGGAPMEATSGTAHLRARAAESRRLRNAGESFKNLLSSNVIEWRQRDTPEGLRLYALVDRTQIAGFRERLSKREREVSVCWSGPWPATEFLESPPEI